MSKKKTQPRQAAATAAPAATATATAAVEEDKPLTVDDIPGAVAPTAEDAPAVATEAASEDDSGSLRNRLSAFRERRTGGEGNGAIAGARRAGTGPRGRAAAGGTPAGAMSARRAGGASAGGGGRAALQARRGASAASGSDDAAAKGKEILKQVIARMNTQGADDKPLHKALKGVARGYQALENEVARLREELDSYKR